MKYRAAVACLPALAALATGPAQAGDPPARVMLVATYHFGNPGKDLSNAQAVDMLTPARQAELKTISAGLSRFAPTVVAIEWNEKSAREGYAAYLKGAPASANEGEQLGFRLAAALGLRDVYGIDVGVVFPYEGLKCWASGNGMAE